MTLKVTVTNTFIPKLKEEFICHNVDITDKDETDYCAEECCGIFLDMHGDEIQRNCPDVDWDTIAEKCSWMIEEVRNGSF
jgi:hypothetical protein